MATPRTTGQSGKKTRIPPKPNTTQQINQLDHFVTGTPPPIDPKPPTAELEKGKIKRLTLDISEDLHKAIKMQSVALGVPMVDMLRKLLESNYGNL
jgi:hypothetical protein